MSSYLSLSLGLHLSQPFVLDFSFQPPPDASLSRLTTPFHVFGTCRMQALVYLPTMPHKATVFLNNHCDFSEWHHSAMLPFLSSLSAIISLCCPIVAFQRSVSSRCTCHPVIFAWLDIAWNGDCHRPTHLCTSDFVFERCATAFVAFNKKERLHQRHVHCLLDLSTWTLSSSQMLLVCFKGVVISAAAAGFPPSPSLSSSSLVTTFICIHVKDHALSTFMLMPVKSDIRSCPSCSIPSEGKIEHMSEEQMSEEQMSEEQMSEEQMKSKERISNERMSR